MKRWLVALALTLWLAPAEVPAAAPPMEARLQAVLDVFLEENGVAPGASACVICPAAGLDWTGAAGTVARNNATPMTAAHTYRIASNTKTYVAAAILRLVEQDRLGLDDPLRLHLTSEQRQLLEGDGYDLAVMTIAQVLSHTAGLGDHTRDPRYEQRIFIDPRYEWTAAEQLELLVEWQDPVGEPGEKYLYSDSGYVLLGTILERLTGRRLGPAVRDLLDFEGLGLTATHWEIHGRAARGAPRPPVLR